MQNTIENEDNLNDVSFPVIIQSESPKHKNKGIAGVSEIEQKIVA